MAMVITSFNEVNSWFAGRPRLDTDASRLPLFRWNFVGSRHKQHRTRIRAVIFCRHRSAAKRARIRSFSWLDPGRTLRAALPLLQQFHQFALPSGNWFE